MSGDTPIVNKMEAKLNWVSPMMLSYCSKVIMPWSGCSDHPDIASEAICLPKNFTKALPSIFLGMTVGSSGRAIYGRGGGGGLGDKVFYGQCENVEG